MEVKVKQGTIAHTAIGQVEMPEGTYWVREVVGTTDGREMAVIRTIEGAHVAVDMAEVEVAE